MSSTPEEYLLCIQFFGDNVVNSIFRTRTHSSQLGFFNFFLSIQIVYLSLKKFSREKSKTNFNHFFIIKNN